MLPPLHSIFLRGTALFFFLTTESVVANQPIIDSRQHDDLTSDLGDKWRLVTDQVMGGVSNGALRADSHAGRPCLHLTGAVSTKNNGGFVQMALDINGQAYDASSYSGVVLQVAGNREVYNLHLRTTDLSLPWQSYRATFSTGPEWQEVRIPFEQLAEYRTFSRFRAEALTRIGLVAIGREFDADLCLADVRFYP